MPNELDDKIEKFEKKIGKEKRPASMFNMATGGASRAGSEFIIAILFFTIVGLLIDWQVGTLPWVTLGLLLLGFITGLYNAWRSLTARGDRVGVTQVRARPEKRR